MERRLAGDERVIAAGLDVDVVRRVRVDEVDGGAVQQAVDVLRSHSVGGAGFSVLVVSNGLAAVKG
jgi:hypothetical protein